MMKEEKPTTPAPVDQKKLVASRILCDGINMYLRENEVTLDEALVALVSNVINIALHDEHMRVTTIDYLERVLKHLRSMI